MVLLSNGDETMKRKQKKELIVGLDIGTSQVVCLVGEVKDSTEVNIVGVGTHPSAGLKRGVVVNIDQTIDAIQKAVEVAEDMANCHISSAFTGISGSHIRSLNSHGVVPIAENEVEITDIDRVIDAARAVPVPADQQILHVLPQDFIVDGQSGIRDPIGMSGVRLETDVHIVTGAMSAAQNIIKCVKHSGLNVTDMVLEQLASSYAVLSEDEKELGVCLVDIGGGTADISVFTKGAICHTAVIPVAGDQVTNDIAVAFRTPQHQAEKLKINHACALKEKASAENKISIPAVQENSSTEVTEVEFAAVVEPRYQELFALVKDELYRNKLIPHIGAGIVLTGGASKVPYAVSLALRIFSMPVRLGEPLRVTGVQEIATDPAYSTAVGLLLYGYRNPHAIIANKHNPNHSKKSVFKKMKSWLAVNF
jgi:cell division protein FtsA